MPPCQCFYGHALNSLSTNAYGTGLCHMLSALLITTRSQFTFPIPVQGLNSFNIVLVIQSSDREFHLPTNLLLNTNINTMINVTSFPLISLPFYLFPPPSPETTCRVLLIVESAELA